MFFRSTFGRRNKSLNFTLDFVNYWQFISLDKYIYCTFAERKQKQLWVIFAKRLK